MGSFDFKKCHVGDVLPQETIGPVSNLQLVKWAAGSGDFNPIHFDLNVAHKQGLENVLVHGPFKCAFAVSILMSWIGRDGHIARISSTYTGMDISGNSLTMEGTVTAVTVNQGRRTVELDYRLLNQRGEKTVSGSASVIVE